MAGFDYDVLIIGSGFGGSVAALRAAEKGYRIGVMESGQALERRRHPEDPVGLAGFLWFPGAELTGSSGQYRDDVLVLCGAGVGGGSHVYANTLYVPPRKFFDAPEWAGITDWADELAPYIDQASCDSTPQVRRHPGIPLLNGRDDMEKTMPGHPTAAFRAVGQDAFDDLCTCAGPAAAAWGGESDG